MFPHTITVGPFSLQGVDECATRMDVWMESFGFIYRQYWREIRRRRVRIRFFNTLNIDSGYTLDELIVIKE